MFRGFGFRGSVYLGYLILANWCLDWVLVLSGWDEVVGAKRAVLYLSLSVALVMEIGLEQENWKGAIHRAMPLLVGAVLLPLLAWTQL